MTKTKNKTPTFDERKLLEAPANCPKCGGEPVNHLKSSDSLKQCGKKCSNELYMSAELFADVYGGVKLAASEAWGHAYKEAKARGISLGLSAAIADTIAKKVINKNIPLEAVRVWKERSKNPLGEMMAT